MSRPRSPYGAVFGLLILCLAVIIGGLLTLSQPKPIHAHTTAKQLPTVIPPKPMNEIRDLMFVKATLMISAKPPQAPSRYPLTYKVQQGDTLYGIAAKQYKNGDDWPFIYIASKLKDTTIYVGEKLTVPAPTGKIPHVNLPAPTIPEPVTPAPVVVVAAPSSSGAGIFSFSGLESLWVSAGGPSWAEAQAATIAECESGGNANAYNPSGASGIWQILGQIVPGNIFDPMVNALNAVAKFKESGDTFAQWVCQ